MVPKLTSFMIAVVVGQALCAIGAPASTRNADIGWFSCSEFNPQYSIGDALNITCGYYEVPLDYADETAGTAKLAVARFLASGERWGTLFVNPGGPGGSGVEYVVGFGLNISVMTGGNYDIVSWDPRGSEGHTEPGPPACFDTAADYYGYFNGTLQQTGIEIRGYLRDDNQTAEFYSH